MKKSSKSFSIAMYNIHKGGGGGVCTRGERDASDWFTLRGHGKNRVTLLARLGKRIVPLDWESSTLMPTGCVSQEEGTLNESALVRHMLATGVR